MHQPEKIVKSSFVYTAALIAQKILSFSYFWYLSSRLMPDTLGAYVWALSFTTLFSIGVDLGLAPVLTREAAKEPSSAQNYLKTVLGFKFLLGVLTFLALWCTLFFSNKSAEMLWLVLGASAIMIFDSFSLSFYAILRSRQNLQYESLGVIIFQIITISLGVLFWETTRSIAVVMLALVIASLFNLIFSFSILKWKLRFDMKPEFNWPVARHFLQIVPAFALAGIFIKIYNVADSVLLGYIRGEGAVGLYSVPAKIITALQALIPGALSAVVFPSMSNYYATSKERLQKLFEKFFGYLILLALPLTAGLYILAPAIIQLVWPKYLNAVLTFKIMSLGIPFTFAAFATGSLLNACDKQKQNTLNRGIIAAANIVLNVALIPLLGILGAGIAFLISNIVLLSLDLVWVEKTISYQKKKLIILAAKSILASFLMALVIWFFRDKLNLLFLILSILAGAIIYFAALMLLRGLTRDEIRNLWLKLRLK